jgi:hypothetical protein
MNRWYVSWISKTRYTGTVEAETEKDAIQKVKDRDFIDSDTCESEVMDKRTIAIEEKVHDK